MYNIDLATYPEENVPLRKLSLSVQKVIFKITDPFHELNRNGVIFNLGLFHPWAGENSSLKIDVDDQTIWKST